MVKDPPGKTLSDERADGNIPAGKEHVPEMVGTEFIFRFYRLLKGASLYDRNNATIERLTQEALQTINPFVQSQEHLFLKIVRDNFFFNNFRIPVKADRYSIFKIFSQEMARRMIGELEFNEEVTTSTLKDFVFLLSSPLFKMLKTSLALSSSLFTRGNTPSLTGASFGLSLSTM